MKWEEFEASANGSKKRKQRNFHHFNDELKYEIARKIAFFSSLSCAHIFHSLQKNHPTFIHYLALLHSFFKLLVYDDNEDDGWKEWEACGEAQESFFLLLLKCWESHARSAFAYSLMRKKPLKPLEKMLKRLKNYSFLSLDYVTTRKSKNEWALGCSSCHDRINNMVRKKTTWFHRVRHPLKEAEEIDTMFLSEWVARIRRACPC